jgi:hypothetical protein
MFLIIAFVTQGEIPMRLYIYIIKRFVFFVFLRNRLLLCTYLLFSDFVYTTLIHDTATHYVRRQVSACKYFPGMTSWVTLTSLKPNNIFLMIWKYFSYSLVEIIFNFTSSYTLNTLHIYMWFISKPFSVATCSLQIIDIRFFQGRKLGFETQSGR